MADQQKGLGERVGNESHDAADTGNPVKVGGHATAALRSAVTEDDRVDLSCDLAGQVRITNEDSDPLAINGDVAHDATDSGNPVKIGGRGRTSTDASVLQDDRVDAAFTRTGGLLISGTAGTTLVNLSVDTNGNSIIVGNRDHDIADTGSPVKIGFRAVEFNSDPATVSADDDRVDSIATPQGIQWVLGGHPNIINREWMATLSQTNDPIIDSVAAGSQIIITQIAVTVDADGTTTPQVRIGFGTASVPAEPTNGNSVDGMVVSLAGIAAGSGIVLGNGSGAIAIGGDGEELRITSEVPTTGKIVVTLSYYISTL